MPISGGGGGGGAGITALTGDVAASGPGSASAIIADDATTYAKIQNVSATDKILGRASSGAGNIEEIECTAAGRALLDDADAAAQRVTVGLSTFAVQFTIAGVGGIITTGVKGDITFPFACTLTSVQLLGDQTGSIVIDLWKDTYANFPPTVANTITASAKPTISATNKSLDTTLTGWTVSIAAGDIIRASVDSITSLQRVHMLLTFTR